MAQFLGGAPPETNKARQGEFITPEAAGRASFEATNELAAARPLAATPSEIGAAADTPARRSAGASRRGTPCAPGRGQLLVAPAG